MYAGSEFNYIDLSDIQDIPQEAAPTAPLFMVSISSDKGPEDLMVTSGKAFFNLYGSDISFAKHGQPLIQAAQIVAAGGRLLVKRVVAEDSAFANIIILAKVKKLSVQKTNASGALLYIDATTGAETTTVSETKAMMNTVKVKYEAVSAENVKDLESLITIAEGYSDLDGTADTSDNSTVYTYPLFLVSDNGRGISNKKIRIVPDYNSSKKLEYMVYNFITMENTTNTESVQFTADPEVVFVGENLSLSSKSKKSLIQSKARSLDVYLESYITDVATALGYTADDFRVLDILFGTDRKGIALPNFTIDSTGLALDYVYGTSLLNGANGAFGIAPFKTTAYVTESVKFWNGKFTDDIYDLDNYKIDVIADANYPVEVKRAIEAFATFRKDASYFRDLGLNLNSFEEWAFAHKDATKNMFCSTYGTTYDIIDPYSKKQINVTMMYDFAPFLVEHYTHGCNLPAAGQSHGAILSSAIAGTVNFIPKITPNVNQKSLLEDERINYAAYQDGILVVETLYTSQEKHTQWSYNNNVLGIQEVVKAVRSFCPKNRYAFLDGEDLDNYKKEVENVLDKYKAHFKSLEFVYYQDSVMEANKIFYAAIKSTYRNFIQSEIFDVYALG